MTSHTTRRQRSLLAQLERLLVALFVISSGGGSTMNNNNNNKNNNNKNNKNNKGSGSGSAVANAEFLPADQVSVDWRYAIGERLGRGNAIASAGDALWVTAASGALYRLPARGGDPNNNSGAAADDSSNNIFDDNATAGGGVAQFVPINTDDSTRLSCQSGVVFVANDDDDDGDDGTLIYAVLDTAASTEDDNEDDDLVSSRILGLRASTLELQWSVTLPGAVQGTPALGQTSGADDDDDDDAYYLYASHYSRATGGQVSVVKVRRNSRGGGAELAATIDLGNDPVTAVTVRSSSRERGGDAAYVAATTESTDGRLWSVVRSDEHAALGGVGAAAYERATVSDLASSAAVPPAVTAAGGVYLGQHGSLVLGWRDGGDGSGVPDWGYSFAPGERNAEDPISVQPVLSADEEFLFVAAAGPEIASLRLDQGRIAWSDEIDRPLQVKPVYFRDEATNSDVLYVADGGSLRQYDASRGTLNWEEDFCGSDNENNNGDCPAIRADFALSANGNLLYYGDDDGNLVAVRVGSWPTPAPTSVPTAQATTIAPTTLAPSPAPTQEAAIDLQTRAPVAAPVAPSPPVAAPVAPPVGTSNNNNSNGSSDADRGFSDAQGQQDAQEEQSSNTAMDLLPAILGGICAVLFVMIGIIIIQRKRNQRSKCGFGSGPDDDTSEDDEEAARRSLHDKIAKVLQEEEVNELTTTPTKGRSASRSSSFNGDTPITLTSIAETPESFNDDGTVDAESVGYEVKSVASDPDMAKNLDDAFSVASLIRIWDVAPGEKETVEKNVSSNSSNNNAEEEVSLASASVTSARSASKPVSSVASASVASAHSVSKPASSVASATASVSSTKSSMSQKLLETVAAAGAAVGLLASDGEEEKKDDSDSVTSAECNIIRESKSGDLTRAVSPLPSPTPSYLNNEPGPIAAQKSPVQRAVSPVGSLVSYDESLYIDESTIGEQQEEITGDEPLLEEALDQNGQTVDADECPEDEITGKVRPGSHYLSRHKAKKVQADLEPPKIQLDRSRPMFKGVSVRPSRSRAGLFSRRQPPLLAGSGALSDQEDADLPDVPTAKPAPAPLSKSAIVKRAVTPPQAVVPPKQQQKEDEDPESPHFTRAGYYVEESEREKQEQETAADPWSSFLNELSKVEDQFFNPTAGKKKPKGTGKQGKGTTAPEESNRPHADSADSASLDESLEPPPPAPRTFYA